MSVKDCTFCNFKNYGKRLFWRHPDQYWHAFLSSQPITRGHTILLMTSHYDGLVEAVDNSTAMKEFSRTLKHIVKVLHTVYQSRIMMASMNLGEEHFHIHLYPAHMKEIKQWWKKHSIEKGAMLSFLGEKEGIIYKFVKHIWKESFSKSIHEAADDLIKDREVLEKVAKEISF